MRAEATILSLAAAISFTAWAADVPHVKHVAVVIFENADYQDVLAESYFSAFARQGALATNLTAEVHPSQGNYIALTSGDTQGVRSDANVNLDARHIGDLLEAAGKTWKVYAENYPGRCFLGTSRGDYARKHVPFLSYKNIQSSPARCANIVEASELDRDLAANALPDLIFYVPNMKNDGHDTGVGYANDWFERRFGALMDDRRFMDGTLVIATYDEASRSDPRNQIFTALAGDMVKPGSRHTADADHYSLLKTIELALGVGDLGKRDRTATPLSGIWK